MKLSKSTRRLLAGAVVGILAMTPAYALAQDEEAAERQRARQEAQREAERAAAREAQREAQREARTAEREARDAERAAQEEARGAVERAARVRGQQGEGGLFRVAPAAVETKPQTYLGVSTEQLGRDAAAEIDDLPAGVGLVINYLDKEGPAATAGLKQGDVLVRMDDQLLVNAAQLTTLIRMHKEGDEATFTVLREGEEQEIDVELGEKELPVMQPLGEFRLIPGVPVAPVPAIEPIPPIPPIHINPRVWRGQMEGLDPEQIEEINRKINEAMAQIERQMQGMDMGELQERMQELREDLLERQLELERLPRDAMRRGDLRQGLRSGGRLYINNEDVSLRMLNDDGEITIVVEDADGKTLYEGPYPTDEQLEDLPDEVQGIIRQARKFLPLEQPTPAAPARRQRQPAAEEEEDEQPRPTPRRRESIPV